MNTDFLKLHGFNEMTRSELEDEFPGADENCLLRCGEWFAMLVGPDDSYDGAEALRIEAAISVDTANLVLGPGEYDETRVPAFFEFANTNTEYRLACEGYDNLWARGRAYVDAHPDEEQAVIAELEKATARLRAWWN